MHLRAAGLILAIAALAGCRTETAAPRRGQTPEAVAYEKAIKGSLYAGDDLEYLVALDDRVRQWNQAHEKFDFREEQRLAADLRRAVDQRMDFLVHVLASHDLEGRLVAASALGFSGDRAAVEPLLAAGGDENLEVRTNAFFAIGILGSHETPMDPLLVAMHDQNSEVRAAAAFAIAGTVSLGDDRGSYASLVEALGDEDWRVANHAVRALGIIQKRECVAVLIQRGLRSPAYLVRLNSAAALAAIRAPEALEPLIDSLKDDEPQVQKMATFALEKITGESFGNDEPKWRDWWREAKERYFPPAQPPEPPNNPPDGR